MPAPTMRTFMLSLLSAPAPAARRRRRCHEGPDPLKTASVGRDGTPGGGTQRILSDRRRGGNCAWSKPRSPCGTGRPARGPCPAVRAAARGARRRRSTRPRGQVQLRARRRQVGRDAGQGGSVVHELGITQGIVERAREAARQAGAAGDRPVPHDHAGRRLPARLDRDVLRDADRRGRAAKGAALHFARPDRRHLSGLRAGVPADTPGRPCPACGSQQATFDPRELDDPAHRRGLDDGPQGESAPAGGDRAASRRRSVRGPARGSTN